VNQNVACTTIDRYLLGLWNNIAQAQASPHAYASIFMHWQEIEGGFQSQNYYRTDGPSNPYRKRFHKKVNISDTQVLIENYDLDWTKSEECGMMFTFDGNAWHGSVVGNCVVNGVEIKSKMSLFGDKLHSCDQGYVDGRMIWGSKETYKFVKTKNAF